VLYAWRSKKAAAEARLGLRGVNNSHNNKVEITTKNGGQA